MRVVGFEIIERVMQTATFFAGERGIDDERGDGGEVAEFEKISVDFEIPIEFLDFVLEIAKSRAGALEAFVGADDADVVPHEAADFVPVVVDDDEFIDVLRVAAFPFWQRERREMVVSDGRVFQNGFVSAMRHDDSFEQRIAGEAICAVKSGAGDFANS